MESVNDVLRRQEAASAVDDLIEWAERHLDAEEGPGETDRPEYTELRSILARVKGEICDSKTKRRSKS